ncbi:lipoyl(octanoyl) transferase LipB [Crocosphaera sp. Alani8]|uniref:lipoyl(octanoyl) transferase LipB n=1 Tax=Crocosphaera sp. Alani8 TaxID=3038952 RepID=UPI00313C2E14
MSTSTSLQPRRCKLKNLGMISYEAAWEMQRSLVKQRIENPLLEDTLILLEHPPVYTLGTGSNTQFIKFDPKQSVVPVYRTERGGEVTYHCPGQLVGYPILNLRYYQRDLHWYLRQIEEVIIEVLNYYQLPGERIPGLTGVWVNNCKVAAIGIKVKRWITMHGFSINVCPDLQGFQHIIPCGIKDKSVGSLQQFIPEISLEEIQTRVIDSFAKHFCVEYV